MKRLPIIFGAVMIWTSLALLLVTCGAFDKKKSDDGEAVTPSPLPSAAGLLPADWDGTDDWSGSAWEVVEQ